MTAATIGSRRINAAFSPDGRRASCIRVRDEQIAVERWHFPADRPTRCGPIAGVVADLGTQTLPLDDGRVLLLPNAEEEPPCGDRRSRGR